MIWRSRAGCISARSAQGGRRCGVGRIMDRLGTALVVLGLALMTAAAAMLAGLWWGLRAAGAGAPSAPG